MKPRRDISEAFFQGVAEGDLSTGITPHRKLKQDKVWGIRWGIKNRELNYFA
jgi:hypothetical protein